MQTLALLDTSSISTFHDTTSVFANRRGAGLIAFTTNLLPGLSIRNITLKAYGWTLVFVLVDRLRCWDGALQRHPS